MKSTREDIVDAALRLVHVRGFNNTSVEDILKESGFGKGNFYYYFKSKDELGFAILERVLEHLNSELIEKSFDQSKNPWQQLNDFLDELVERARQRECSGGCILGNLAVEMSDIHEEFRLRLNKAFDQLRTCVEKALTQARAQGTLRSNADTPGLALFIIAGFEGTFMMGKLQKDADVVASVVEELKEHLAHFRAAK
jgi:TetR/AcrR family transcriptional repressor of nem operon